MNQLILARKVKNTLYGKLESSGLQQIMVDECWYKGSCQYWGWNYETSLQNVIVLYLGHIVLITGAWAHGTKVLKEKTMLQIACNSCYCEPLNQVSLEVCVLPFCI